MYAYSTVSTKAHAGDFGVFGEQLKDVVHVHVDHVVHCINQYNQCKHLQSSYKSQSKLVPIYTTSMDSWLGGI